MAVPLGEPRPVQAFHPAAAPKSPLLPCVIGLNALAAWYSSGCTSPTGVPREEDKNHAMALLSTATDQTSYERVLARMKLGMFDSVSRVKWAQIA